MGQVAGVEKKCGQGPQGHSGRTGRRQILRWTTQASVITDMQRPEVKIKDLQVSTPRVLSLDLSSRQSTPHPSLRCGFPSLDRWALEISGERYAVVNSHLPYSYRKTSIVINYKCQFTELSSVYGIVLETSTRSFLSFVRFVSLILLSSFSKGRKERQTSCLLQSSDSRLQSSSNFIAMRICIRRSVRGSLGESLTPSCSVHYRNSMGHTVTPFT